MTRLNRLPIVPALLLIAVFSVACSPRSGSTPTPSPKDTISIQLSWVHEYSSAPFYAAEKNGHFAEQNLQVSLVEGGFSDGKYIEPIDQVANGTVDFGLSSASNLLVARSAGKAVVGLASVLQRSPLAVITLAKSNIRRPQDLIGKKVAVADGGANQVYTSMLVSQGIDPSKVNTVSRTSFGVDPLIKGEVDAMVGWIINEGVQIREAGQEPSFMLMSDYGVDSYDFVVFTSEKILKERPAVVERLLKALVSGLKDVIASPDKAVDYVMLYGKNLERQGQSNRLQATIPLINPAGSKPGTMTDSNWQIAYKILADQKVIQNPIAYKTAYNTQIIDKIYSGQ